MARARGFATRAVHGTGAPGATSGGASRPVAEPIVQTASFAFDSTDELARGVHERGFAYSYSRLENPTTDAFARTVADLEGAEAGIALASGMAAVHAAVAALVRAGDHVVAARALYGNSTSLVRGFFSRFGVEATFVDATDAANVAAAMRPRTRAVLCETIANPTLCVTDLPAVARAAHAGAAALVVDNTFATPALCRPVEHGADLVVHSATKYLGGHGDLIAGVVAGRRDLVAAAQAVAIDTGGVAAPFVAWLALRGVRTLALRMERHSASALAVARHLEKHARVERVHHPFLEGHPQHALARRLLAAGGGMVAFVARGGFDAARRVLDALEIFRRAGSLGDVHSLAVHPASTSHRQLDADERRAAGLPDGLVRLSIGLEDVEDLIDDLDHALGHAPGQALGRAPERAT